MKAVLAVGALFLAQNVFAANETLNFEIQGPSGGTGSLIASIIDVGQADQYESIKLQYSGADSIYDIGSDSRSDYLLAKYTEVWFVDFGLPSQTVQVDAGKCYSDCNLYAYHFHLDYGNGNSTSLLLKNYTIAYGTAELLPSAPSAVPEPASASLLLAGLGAVGGLLVIRRKVK